MARCAVDGLGRLVGAARDPKLKGGRVPDRAEAGYPDDPSDGGFGHALNLACDPCSERGHAPVGGSRPRPDDAASAQSDAPPPWRHWPHHA